MSTFRASMPGVRQAALDLVALAGLGAFVFGVHQVFPPAAWMVGGLALLAGAALAAKRSGS